jgi:hypothetical protein
MSHSTVHNRGFFRLDVQMEGQPLLSERKRHNGEASADLEAPDPAEYVIEPPRLQNSTACAKVALGCCALGCCVLFGLVLGAILNTGPMVFLRTLVADVVAPTTPAAPPRPLPAILKRVRTMQRATAPGDHGVSTTSMLAAFPTWSRNGTVQVEDALKDLSLALVMLSNHLPSVTVLFEHLEL